MADIENKTEKIGNFKTDSDTELENKTTISKLTDSKLEKTKSNSQITNQKLDFSKLENSTENSKQIILDVLNSNSRPCLKTVDKKLDVPKPNSKVCFKIDEEKSENSKLKIPEIDRTSDTNHIPQQSPVYLKELQSVLGSKLKSKNCNSNKV